MSHYTVVYAVNVPHYGRTQIEATTPAEAIAAAKHRDPAEICTERDRGNAACSRIVSITDDNGRSIAEGVTLDGALCDMADALPGCSAKPHRQCLKVFKKLSRAPTTLSAP